MTKTGIGVIVIILLIVAGGAYLWTGESTTTINNSTSQEPSTASGEGRVVFSVTDAAVNMSAISEINMKVSKVEMHSQASGWATVSTTPHTYSLLMLNAKNESQVLSDTKVKAGTYDQVRFMVDNVSIKTKAGETKEAVLPAHEMAIATMVLVNADETTSVSLDVLADKSLYTTTDGKYVFAPVVKAETRSETTVEVKSDSSVSISGGHVDGANTVGMDVDGSVKLNFQISGSTKIDLNSDNTIKLDALLQ